MMNRLLLTLFLALSILPIQAQSYTVYSVIGNAKLMQGMKELPLKPKKQLNAKNRLKIEAESAITLLDEKNSKMYSFSAEGSYTVEQLVAKASNRARVVPKQYMSYLVKQLFSKDSDKMLHPSTYMQVTATSYRSASTDSMLLSRITQALPFTEGLSAEEQICSPDNELTGDLNVRFELISCDTGYAINGNVEGNTGSYVRIHNDTESSLYVNVLDIDSNGNKYLVLPVDSAATCAHLLVPAMSTVSFKSEPFIFSGDSSKETFFLVATEEPVDFSILMSPIRGSGRKPMKTGFYRKIYQIQ